MCWNGWKACDHQKNVREYEFETLYRLRGSRLCGERSTSVFTCNPRKFINKKDKIREENRNPGYKTKKGEF